MAGQILGLKQIPTRRVQSHEPHALLAQVERLRGVSLADAARRFPVSQLRKVRNAREIEFVVIGGHPFLVVRHAAPLSSRLISAEDSGALDSSLVIPDILLLSAVQAAWSPVGVLGIQAIAENDAYRVRSNPLPDTARRVVLDDPAHTWVQLDAASGQIISVVDRSRRVYRWLFDGLHSFDFPVFNHTGPLRHVLVLMASAVGFLFSCTGVVIGVKRLKRSLS